MNKRTKTNFTISGILAFIIFGSWIVARTVSMYEFNIEAGGHLKRAADANTVELAKQELQTSVKYLKENNLTSGYTSVFFKTPDEDVSFWYNNLNSSLEELDKLSPNASQLEKTNVLMKLRETLLDHGEKSTSVTTPDGISIFPHNVVYAVWVVVGAILTASWLVWAFVLFG